MAFSWLHTLHTLLVGRAPGRGLILAGQGETEFSERQLGLLHHLRSPNAAQPLHPHGPQDSPPLSSLPSPPSPHLPAQLTTTITGLVRDTWRIICSICACVSVHTTPCVPAQACAHSGVPRCAQYLQVCLGLESSPLGLILPEFHVSSTTNVNMAIIQGLPLWPRG